MITYPYEYLFKEDSVDKQLIITDGEITLTNVDIYQESFELTEMLSATRDLTYGSCNSATLKFTTSKLERFKGRELTVSVVLDGHTEAPFTFGTYKVYEDKFTADRTKKDIVCKDTLYEVINANVIDWYDTILPDMETTVTLKQFRDSFFEQFGITQETITLDNDSVTIQRTISGEVLSGAEVLRRICEMNGCFGRINRQGNFEYFYVHATSNPLYPALTLYPSEDLFPQFDGQYDAIEIGENGTYIFAQYEDYDCMPVDKLIVRQEDGDVGVEVGTGTNAYIVQGNFLLYGKSTTELTPIVERMFEHIGDGAYYRPCEIELKGNPCIEIGDGITLLTRSGDKIVTFVTNRVYSGIQAQRDIYTSEGTEYRDEEVNTIDTQLYQLRNKSNILTRDLEHTESVITDDILNPDNPESLQSQITQTAEEVEVKVDKVNGSSSDSFSWVMNSNTFDIKNNNNSVLKVTSSGAEINGKVTATSGYIGSSSQGFVIDSDDIHNGMTSLSDTTNNGIYIGTDGIALGKGNFKVTNAGAITAKSGNIAGFTIKDSAIYKNTDSMSSNTNGVYLGTDGINLAGKFKVTTAGAVSATSGNIGSFTIDTGFKYNTSGGTLGYILPSSSGGFGGVKVGGQSVQLEASRSIDIGASDTTNTSIVSQSISLTGNNPVVIKPQAKIVGGLTVRDGGDTRDYFVVPKQVSGSWYVWGYTSYYNGSDRRIKQDIETLDSEKAKDFIMKLNPCEYRLIDTPERKHHGFIAQEVKESAYEDWSAWIEDEKMMSLSYTELIADLVATVQNQQKQIDELKQIINKKEGDWK